MIDIPMEEVLLSVFAWVCLAAWRALPLFILVLVFDLALSRRIAAKYHCLMWAVVMLCLLCPFSIETPFGMQGRATSWMQSIGFSNKAAALVTLQPYATKGLTGDSRSLRNQSDQSETIRLLTLPKVTDEAEYRSASEPASNNAWHPQANSISPDATIHALRKPPVDIDVGTALTLLLVALWWLVAMGMMLRAAIQSIAFALRLRRSPIVSEQAVVDQVLRICDVLRVGRRPVLRVVAGLQAPAVFGVWRPTICLPPGALEQLSAEQLRLVLMHELAHAKRRDGLLLSVAGFVRCLHWFNPVAWVVVWRLRNYMEQAADASVLKNESNGKLAEYGRLLLQFASREGERAPAAVGLLFASPGKTLARRLLMLRANSGRGHWFAQAAAMVCVIVLAACGLTDASSNRSSPNSRAENVEVALPANWFHPTSPQDLPTSTVTLDASAALEKIRETEPQCNAEQRLLNQFDPTKTTLQNGTLRVVGDEATQHQYKQALAALAISGCWETEFRIRMGVADMQSTTKGLVDWERDSVLPLRDERPQHLPPRSGAFFFPITPSSSKGKPLTIEFHEQKTAWRPLLGVRLNQEQTATFLKRSQSDVRTAMLEAPRVALLHGRTASLVNESLRPFVTGVRPIVSDDAVALQPIVDVISDGNRLLFRGVVGEDERLALQLRLTMSGVNDVSLAHLPFVATSGSTGPATIQVPQASNLAATVNASLAKSESLLIVAPMPFRAEQPQQGSVSVFFLITPAWKRGLSIPDNH